MAPVPSPRTKHSSAVGPSSQRFVHTTSCVVQALEQTSQLNRTVIFFTADNGAPFGDALYDGDDPAFLDFETTAAHDGAPRKPRPPEPGQGPNKRCGKGGGQCESD